MLKRIFNQNFEHKLSITVSFDLTKDFQKVMEENDRVLIWTDKRESEKQTCRCTFFWLSYQGNIWSDKMKFATTDLSLKCQTTEMIVKIRISKRAQV